ncbi:MAG: hypothetical protein GY807_00505 [Gammaproteobacteria bacterium]|nr:hypothetical protein [Gammaproteobacteria bacterium]
MDLRVVTHYLNIGNFTGFAILLLLNILLAGCGGGEGGGGEGPMVDISFPLPNSNLGGEADRVVLRGRVTTTDGARVNQVLINNQSFRMVTQKPPADLPDGDMPMVEFDRDDSSHWFAQIALLQQVNDISIDASDDRNRSTSVTLAVQNGATFSRPVDVVLDSTNNRVLLVDSSSAALLAVNLASGDRRLISGLNTGTGVSFVSPKGLALDIANNRALVVDSSRPGRGLNALLAVDLTTGNRTVISNEDITRATDVALDMANNRVLWVKSSALLAVDLNSGEQVVVSQEGEAGDGIPFSIPEYVVLAANGRALVVDAGLAALLEVDLSNGDRRVISGVSTGSGTALQFPRAAAVDADNSRALVVDEGLNAVLEIDLSNGNRRVISNISKGQGPLFGIPEGIAFDMANNRVLVVDFESLLEVDLVSGDRRVISDPNAIQIAGPSFFQPRGVTLDKTNNRLLVADGGRAEDGRSPNYSLLEVDLATGDRRLISGADRGVGPMFILLESVALDAANNRALVTDIRLDALLAVDLTSGDRRVISDADKGDGPSLNRPLDMVLDAANNRALVLDPSLTALLEIDLDNGDRRVISDASRGVGLPFEGPSGVVLDAANNRAFVVDPDLGISPDKSAVLKVDLDSGDREILSGVGNKGAGPVFGRPISIALDLDNNRVLVGDGANGGLKALFEVDLTSGDRQVISDSANGSGPAFNAVLNMALDSDNNRIFLADLVSNTLVVVDLISGDKAIYSGRINN